MKYTFTLINMPLNRNYIWEDPVSIYRKNLIEKLSRFTKSNVTFMRFTKNKGLRSGGDFSFNIKEYYGGNKQDKNPFRIQINKDFVKSQFVNEKSCSVVGRLHFPKTNSDIVIRNAVLTTTIAHNHAVYDKVFFTVIKEDS